jgi:uncharacterized protein (DUF3084 family)
MTVPESALAKFRAVVGDLHAVNGAIREVERRINDFRPTLWDLNTEIGRVERDTRSPWPESAAKAQQRLERLRADVAEVQREIDRLTTERERLQRRRDAASQLACGCRDLIISKFNLPPSAVGF